jgi:hypothetical protein
VNAWEEIPVIRDGLKPQVYFTPRELDLNKCAIALNGNDQFEIMATLKFGESQISTTVAAERFGENQFLVVFDPLSTENLNTLGLTSTSFCGIKSFSATLSVENIYGDGYTSNALPIQVNFNKVPVINEFDIALVVAGKEDISISNINSFQYVKGMDLKIKLGLDIYSYTDDWNLQVYAHESGKLLLDKKIGLLDNQFITTLKTNF